MDETPLRFEPAFLEGALPPSLADLALEVRAASDRSPGRLPPAAARELADLVRIMNSYYSNLIEGNNTRPAEIEAALAGAEVEGRPLLLEAVAHVEVQRHIDALAASGGLTDPTGVAFLKDVHRRFYEAMPDAHRVARLGDREVAIVPGAFRTAVGEDVAVGRHQPPRSRSVGAFMDAFSARFAGARGAAGLILAIPAAHHRLNYIHPFVDGNGRVSRLMSHAMGHRAGIGSEGLWSISRGLARGLADRGEYKRMMDATDQPRRGDLDGRGNLSEKALIAFSEWFLTIALDQIRFCTRAFELDTLGQRYRTHLRALFRNDDRPGKLVSKVLELGEMERGTASAVIGGSERTASSVLGRCVREGFLKSESPKGKVRVAFPIEHRAWLFPGLFADEPVPDRPPPMKGGDGHFPPANGRRKGGWEL